MKRTVSRALIDGVPSERPSLPRPRILVATDYYTPGYRGGGPIRTIAGLVDHLGGKFEFRIVTQDRDAGDREAYPHLDRRNSTWHPVGEALVLYQPPRRRGFLGWLRLLRRTPHDLLYLNSLFSRSTIRLLLARRIGLIPDRPVVVAPRGELSPGALGLKSSRKRLFLALARRLGLFDGLTWHASTELERSEILMALGRGPAAGSAGDPGRLGAVEVAMDLPERHAEAPTQRQAKCPGEARVAFLSRIVRKKNLRYALEILSRVRGRVRFDVFGPREDAAYWSECEALMARLPANITATYRGEIRPELVAPLFADYDLFLFPTRSENFGHVVLEALMAGCPVLISDTTPWRNLEARHAGWDLPLGAPERFVDVVERVVGMEETAHLRWSEGARELARAVASDAGAVEANVTLFTRALARAPHGARRSHVAQ